MDKRKPRDFLVIGFITLSLGSTAIVIGKAFFPTWTAFNYFIFGSAVGYMIRMYTAK